MYLYKLIWKPPSTSELTPYQLSSGLTHLGSEACNLGDLPRSVGDIVLASPLLRS